jgi:hypothetical protein
MARRVYIHIGLPKTGTTYLQSVMWHNRDQLRKQGFLYPGSKRLDHYHAAQAIRDGDPERMGDEADAWERISAELAAWPGVGMLSHEFLSMAKPRQARRAVRELRPARVHVVVTVRDYVRQFPAVWQEALKMNSDLPFDEFMDRALEHRLPGAWSWRSQDIPVVLRRWAKAVPKRRIHVITVPPHGAPRELLWERWCQVLGIDDSEFERDLSFANESLGAPQAALLRRVKPALSGPLTQGPVRHRWVRKYFGHEVLVPQRGPRFSPRPEQAAKLRERSITAVEWIRNGGFEVTGDLDELIPPEQLPSRPHPDDVTESEMLEVAAHAIDQMIRDVRDLTNERDELAEKVQGHSGRRRSVRRRAFAALRKARSR